MVAEWCGARNGGRTTSATATHRLAGQGVHGAQLEGLLDREVGQQPGQALREGRLARALGTAQQQVVTAGGGDLQGEAGVASCRGRRRGRGRRRAPSPRQRSTAPVDTWRHGFGASGTWVAGEHRDHLLQRADARSRRSPGTSAASSTWTSGTRTRVQPTVTAGQHHRQDPAHRAEAAVEGQLAEHHETGQRAACFRVFSSAAASIASAIARSKCEPRLGRSAGDSSDRHAPGGRPARPLLTIAVRQRSRASLTDASGRPTSVVAMTPWADVGLHVDEVTARHRARHHGPGGRDGHSAHPPHVVEPARRPAGSRRIADQVDAHVAARTSCSRSHRAASRRSRASLAGVTASSGDAEGRVAPGLDLAEHEDRTVAEHQVELAWSHLQLRSSTTIPCSRPGGARRAPRRTRPVALRCCAVAIAAPPEQETCRARPT